MKILNTKRDLEIINYFGLYPDDWDLEHGAEYYQCSICGKVFHRDKNEEALACESTHRLPLPPDHNPETIMEGFKVVFRTDNPAKFESSEMSCFEGAGVKYYPNAWATPIQGNMSLTCFTEKERALKYAQDLVDDVKKPLYFRVGYFDPIHKKSKIEHNEAGSYKVYTCKYVPAPYINHVFEEKKHTVGHCFSFRPRSTFATQIWIYGAPLN